MSTQLNRGGVVDDAITVRNTKQVTGNGVSQTNFFQFYGNVHIIEISAEIISKVDNTVFSAINFNVNDTLTTVQLTSSAGTSMAGLPIGSLAYKRGLIATAVAVLSAAAISVGEGAAVGNNLFIEALLNANPALPNYIRFGHTGDALTNVNIEMVVKYKPISQTARVIPI